MNIFLIQILPILIGIAIGFTVDRLTMKDKHGNTVQTVKETIWDSNPFLRAWNGHPRFNWWTTEVIAEAPDLIIRYNMRRGLGTLVNDDAPAWGVARMTFTIGPSKKDKDKMVIICKKGTEQAGNSF